MAMRDPILASYMAEILKIPLIAVEEERRLLKEVKEGNNDALNTLVSSHLRFVVAVCWNYRHKGLPLPDLINEGNLALFRAAEHFDLGNPVRFMSYAVWWIRQGVMDALARQAGSITFPPARMHKAIRYRRIEAILTQKLGRLPTWEEVASKSGDSAQSTATLSAFVEGISSTRGYGPSLATSIEGTDQDWKAAGADADADIYLLRKTLWSLLERLKPNEKRIVALRYGLIHGVRQSLAEVGSIMGISCERVRQVEERAIANLRKAIQRKAFLKLGGGLFGILGRI